MTRSSHGLDTLPDAIDWRQRGACRQEDAALFFPEHLNAAHARVALELARSICARCHVQRECLAYALEHERNFGVFAGLTPEERRQVPR